LKIILRIFATETMQKILRIANQSLNGGLLEITCTFPYIIFFQGLFELITDNSFVVISLPSHHIELPLCVRNQKRTVADTSLGQIQK